MQMKNELDELVQRLQAASGENLQSLVLYGSATGDDFSEQHSDLNLLCVLRESGSAALDAVAPAVKWWSDTCRQRPPLFLTLEELQTSADVFAIETLDIKEHHRVLAGRDVLTAVAVPMNLHRVQVEHELRTLLLRFRQHYLLAPGEDQLAQVLAKSASSVVVLLRHALIAMGKTSVPHGKRNVLSQAAAVFGYDFAALHAALDLREGRRIEVGVQQLYHRCMQAVAAVVRAIDRAAPKKEWQRVGTQGPTAEERIG